MLTYLPKSGLVALSYPENSFEIMSSSPTILLTVNQKYSEFVNEIYAWKDSEFICQDLPDIRLILSLALPLDF